MSDRRHTLLVVDDEEANLQKLERTFRPDFDVLRARDGEAALAELRRQSVSAIITDQKMPGISGVDLLRKSLELSPGAIRIILTGYTEVDDLMDAINQGHVHRYITKPWDPFSLARTVQQEIRQLELEHENSRLATQLQDANRKLRRENLLLREEMEQLRPELPTIIFESPAMRELLRLVDRVVETDSTVLIQGETGTGKELLARYLHCKSLRRKHPFVPVNCGAIPADLAESSFFGHRKGAFTGATETTRGFFEQAHLGTLFLDEVGEAPLDLQVKLLRVLQDGQILPVGAEKPVSIDVRTVASTNRNLSLMVEEGRFRQDLYFRLNVFSIHVPPLRARTGDVLSLAEHFLQRFAARVNKHLPGFDQESIDVLKTHDWPGNVRELENEIERVAILCDDGRLVQASDLSQRISRSPAGREIGSGLKERVASLERSLILDALKRHSNNKTQAAQDLGITRQTIIAKLKQYRIR